MGVGLSDGTNYVDMGEWVAHSTSGVPLEGSTEPAGALKSTRGTQTPDKADLLEKDYLKALSGVENPKAAWDIVKQFASEKYEQFKGALTAPGDAWAGNLDPMSPEGLQRARDLAGLMIGGPAPVAAKMADGSLGSFAGVRSQGMKARYADLGEAQVMKANGEHPDDIFRKTGMFQGADGRWRYEIDDSKAQFIPEKVSSEYWMPLDEVYQHPELYKAYPKLKDVMVIADPQMAGAAYGGGETPYIKLGMKPMENNRVGAVDKGVLAHEIQHWIQEHEGFAPGAFFEGQGIKGTPKTENYLRSAGEVEARNVDTRLEMSADRRRNYPPTWSEDYSRARQIVTRGVGRATDEGLIDLETNQMMR